MKRYFFYIVALLLATSAAAQEYCGMTVPAAMMKRQADLMEVKMQLKLSDFDLSGNRAVVFTPAIVGENDSLLLHPVGFYSRDRWYQYLRSGDGPVGGATEQSIRWSKRPDELAYNEIVSYEEWMNGATLVLLRHDYGCCHTLLDESQSPLTNYNEVRYTPVFRYATNVAAEVKTRELSGRAYIDFPVNRTEIYPDYRKNPTELAKIVATIDSVRNDADVTVTAITIKGYASPESPWSNNTRLAKGRTATLKNYVQQLYHFEEGFIRTDYEPEDWAGLRAFVESSNIAHRAEILAIIDSDMEPDPKEAKIKTTYPEEYKFLLTTIYPALRHSDYTIEYTIRSFSDTDEIGRLLHTQPQKLSLNEILRYVQTLEPGSDAYNEVFEIAVRLFPDDPTANLNAANSAMQRGDCERAAHYLSKAGDSAEAEYARGVLAAMQHEYDKAVDYIEKSRELGLEGTSAVIDHIKEVSEYQF